MGDNCENKSTEIKKRKFLPNGISIEIKGYDFNKGIKPDLILKSQLSSGDGLSDFAKCVEIVNHMLEKRYKRQNLSNENLNLNFLKKYQRNCTIFLGYTSNVVSCGLRETVRYLAEHNLIDAIVTSGGGIEEDFIKCLKPFYIGDFTKFNDATLRATGNNRIGNMLVPNENYVVFEEWLTPILDECLKEQEENKIKWSPSKLIERLGNKIDNKESIYYWCAKNNIPVFCPGITDGSLGDMLYFHNLYNGGDGIKLLSSIDSKYIEEMATDADNTGMIILGGGVIKHYITSANLKRKGCDYAVFINTGNSFEASDSGAPVNQEISWGHIKSTGESVKLHSEVSLVFPKLVIQTFAKFQKKF